MYKINKFLILLLILFIAILILFKKEIPIIEAFNFQDSSISTELLNNYYSHDFELKKNSEREIINKTLRAIEYNNWLEYLDYIEMNLYFSNIIPNNKEELIIALNLSKDTSIVCIFIREGNKYNLYSLIDNLVPIKKIDFYKIPEEDYNLFVIYETLDERLGGYFYEEFFEIYIFRKDDFIKLLYETVLYEEILKKEWIDDSSSSNEWIKNTIENNITFISNSELLINIKGTNKKYLAEGDNNTIPEQFILESSIDYRYTYYWNTDFQNFSLSKEVTRIEGSSVIIQKDNSFDVRFIDDSNKYKIITASGKILYINRNFILKH